MAVETDSGTPRTRYAKADDGVHIAYQVFGDGALDIVFVPGFISHVEQGWDDPGIVRFWEHLAAFARVVIFDKRGTGMSDRTERLPDVDRRMLDIEAVMDAAGMDRAVLFAVSEGGPMAILFAAAHPERVQALVLWGTYARITQAPDYEFGLPPGALQRAADHLEPDWGTGAGLSAWAPSLGDDPHARERWGHLQRLAASPGAAMALMTSYMDIDVRAALPLVDVPTLVLHRAGDRMIDPRHGRYVADGIAGARLVEVPGRDHFFWTEGGDAIAAEIEEFLTGTRSVAKPDRVLATVLFTDIVGSTQRATALGDHAWRALLDAHDNMSRRQAERHGGRVVKTTGDGILATFAGPTRAVQCARAIRDGVRALDIEVRAGLHVGEVELRADDDIAGLGVHVAQRVSALAAGCEILVSRTVVDLVAGSSLEFEDRGTHDLKGVPGSWQLFAVV